MAAVLEVAPRDGQVDEPLAIHMTGLEPGREVTLRARASILWGDHWESQASFAADAAGRVDPARLAPLRGSYAGVEPMGLVWSMAQTDVGDPPEGPSIRPASPWTLELEAIVDGESCARATALRRYAAPGVERTSVRADGLVGSLFLPPGPGPHPVVISMGGSDGGVAEANAALWASHGFAALGLAYFGVETLPAGLAEVPLEYFERAFAWLDAQPRIDAERLGVTGGSRGGELSLLLGATFPRVRAVVAWVPSNVMHSAVTPDGGVRASWTWRGEALPYAGFDPSRVDYSADAVEIRPGFLAGLEDEAAVARAEIPVERTRGPILMLSGEDDRMWPSGPFSELAVRRLEQRGFAHSFEHVCYPGAGHTLGPPYLPTTQLSAPHPVVPATFAFGGSALANARAREDAWPRALAWMHKALG